MTASNSILGERERIDLADVTDVARLIDEPAVEDRRRTDPDPGLVWFFHAEPGEEVPALFVGVRGEVGALRWCDDEDAFVPDNGVEPDWVDYFTGPHGHHAPMPVEVPIGLVREALREFVRTGQRPTCVQWRPEQGSAGRHQEGRERLGGEGEDRTGVAQLGVPDGHGPGVEPISTQPFCASL